MASPKMFDNTCCRWCVKTVKWIPVLFIVTIVVWSYYAYVIQLCLFTVDSIAEKVIFLLLFHVVFALFAWAYWQTIFAEVGRVPRQFRISEVEAEKLVKELSVENQRRMLDVLSRNMPITCRTATGCVRYCEKCRYIKPDRAHHCSACGECILKMDHHCPWVNNCVAFTNYKFFILFLMYSLLYCIYIASTSLPYFIKFWKNELSQAGRFHILFLFFMALMFGISLLSLFGYHCYLVAVNRTTLESFRAPVFRTGPDKSGFDLGVTKNIEQVFGEVRWKWFLPLFTSLGDGILYPTRNPQNIASSYNSMGSTLTSVGSGMSFPKRVNEEDADELLGQRQRWAEEGLDERRRPEQSTAGNTSFSSEVKLIIE